MTLGDTEFRAQYSGLVGYGACLSARKKLLPRNFTLKTEAGLFFEALIINREILVIIGGFRLECPSGHL
jgi:hypothetical protein